MEEKQKRIGIIIGLIGVILGILSIIGIIALIVASKMQFWGKITAFSLIALVILSIIDRAIKAKRFEKKAEEIEKRFEELHQRKHKPFQERVNEMLEMKERKL